MTTATRMKTTMTTAENLVRTNVPLFEHRRPTRGLAKSTLALAIGSPPPQGSMILSMAWQTDSSKHKAQGYFL